MRMLVPTDGSPHAHRAVSFAARLARELRAAEIILVNVGQIPVLALSAPVAAGYVVDFAPLEDALESAGHKVLDEAMKAFAGMDVNVARVYRSGEPSAEVIRTAGESRVDLIVVGARGLGQIGGLFLGSVSERILHAAHCPVLVVR